MYIKMYFGVYSRLDRLSTPHLPAERARVKKIGIFEGIVGSPAIPHSILRPKEDGGT
jgi:hypothetical protein